MGGGGGVLRKRKKKSWRSAKGKQKGLFREAQKGSSLAARGSLSRTFGVLGVFFNFLGLPKFRRQKLLFFFGSSKTLFIFLTRKTPLNLPFFGAFVKKNRVMQKGGPKKKRKSSFGKKEGERKKTKEELDGEKRELTMSKTITHS